jgi:hypothetical protein
MKGARKPERPYQFTRAERTQTAAELAALLPPAIIHQMKERARQIQRIEARAQKEWRREQ